MAETLSSSPPRPLILTHTRRVFHQVAAIHGRSTPDEPDLVYCQISLRFLFISSAFFPRTFPTFPETNARVQLCAHARGIEEASPCLVVAAQRAASLNHARFIYCCWRVNTARHWRDAHTSYGQAVRIRGRLGVDVVFESVTRQRNNNKTVPHTHALITTTVPSIFHEARAHTFAAGALPRPPCVSFSRIEKIPYSDVVCVIYSAKHGEHRQCHAQCHPAEQAREAALAFLGGNADRIWAARGGRGKASRVQIQPEELTTNLRPESSLKKMALTFAIVSGGSVP